MRNTHRYQKRMLEGGRVRSLILGWLSAAAILAGGAGSAQAEDTYDWMYEPESVARIDLGAGEESILALTGDPSEYVPASFSVTGTGGQSFGPVPVELRLKGTASFRGLNGKAAFKLKFAKPNRPWGLKKMTLNNMVQDPSKVREALAYEVFRAMGVPASRTGYANVYLNGEAYGLYLNLETLDDQAMEAWFDSTQHLYEGGYHADFAAGLDSYFEVDEGDEEDTSDLGAFFDAVASDSAGWIEALEPHADLDEIIRMMATEVYLGHFDGYAAKTNNFYAHSDGSGRFSLLPSGADQTFMWRVDYFVAEPKTGIRGLLFKRCLAITACRTRYGEALVEVRQKVLDLGTADRAATLFQLLKPSLTADPRKESTVEAAEDAVGLFGSFLSGQSRVLNQDLVRPPDPPALVEASPESGAIEVSWQPAGTRGLHPVTGYLIGYRPAGSGPYTERKVVGPGAGSLRIEGLRGNAAYEIQVRAISVAGPGEARVLHEPVITAPKPVSRPVLTSGPGRYHASSSATFVFGGEAGAAFDCRLDAEPWRHCRSPLTYRKLEQGPHRVSIRQLDQAGNQSAAIHRRWTVDTSRPRLKQVSLLGTRGGQLRLLVKTGRESSWIWLQVSFTGRPPAGRTTPTTIRLNGRYVGLESQFRPHWARLVDRAGNVSPWKPVA